jgi:hypothetical protein
MAACYRVDLASYQKSSLLELEQLPFKAVKP